MFLLIPALAQAGFYGMINSCSHSPLAYCAEILPWCSNFQRRLAHILSPRWRRKIKPLQPLTAVENTYPSLPPAPLFVVKRPIVLYKNPNIAVAKPVLIAGLVSSSFPCCLVRRLDCYQRSWGLERSAQYRRAVCKNT